MAVNENEQFYLFSFSSIIIAYFKIKVNSFSSFCLILAKINSLFILKNFLWLLLIFID